MHSWHVIVRWLSIAVSAFACAVFLGALSPEPLSSRAALAARVSKGAASVAASSSATAAILRIRVEGVSGALLPGARVTAHRTAHGVPRRAARGSSNARGYFEASVLSGDYWVVVEAEGWAREVLFVQAQQLGGRAIVVALERAHPLRVLVRDEDRAPVSGARVLAYSSDPIPCAGSTGKNGIASLAACPSGVDSFVVQAAGYEPVEVPAGPDGAEVVLQRLGRIEVSVVDEAGGAAEGATVSIAGLSLWPPQEVRTDERGSALILGLERGSYDLRAVRDDAVSLSRLGLVLGSGQRRSVTLHLERGRFVEVVVVDGRGPSAVPVEDAEVVVVENGVGPFPLQGRTDDQGRVSLGPLPLEPAVANVRAAGYVEHAGVEVAEDADRVVVELLRGGTLVGSVVDEAGEPVASASLEVVGNDTFGRPVAVVAGSAAAQQGFFDRGSAEPGAFSPVGELGVMAGPLPSPGSIGGYAPPASVTPWMTDEGGRFRLEQIPPGRLRVIARHPRYVAALSAAVALTPGGATELTIVLPRGGTLEGVVVDERGDEVEGARVDAVDQHAGGRQSQVTDERGAFRFERVSSLVELMVARPEEPHRFALQSRIELLPGQLREVVLSLPGPRAPATVRVLDDLGHPVADARISLVSLEPDVPLRSSVFCDEAGSAVLEDAAGLRAQIRVVADGFRVTERTFEALPAEVVVELSRGVVVTGQVTHVRGRLGLEGATVRLSQGGWHETTVTDPYGDYRFEEVGPGAAELSISHPDYAPRRLSIIVGGSDEREPEALPAVDLVASGAASGLVVDERGAAVASARVGVGLIPAFLPVGEVPSGFVQTDALGRFALQTLPSGPVTLSAYAVGVGRGQVEIEVSAGERLSDVRIVLGGEHPDTEPDTLANLAVTLGERSAEPGLPEVVIVHVAQFSEAEAAGLRPGDVILRVDGQPVAGMGEARVYLGGPAGSDVVLDLLRDEHAVSLRVRREAVRR